MSLGGEVGLGPGDIVLDGDSAPPKWGTAAQTAGWMPLGMEVGLGPSDCVRWRASSRENGAQPPNFRPMSIVTKQ